MRRQIKGCAIGLILTLAVGWLALVPSTARSQPFNTQIQIAINQLVTGVIPFTALRSASNSYLSFGPTGGVNGYGFRDNLGILQFKNSGGSWTSINTGSGDLAASYLTRVVETSLTNETALGTLATGLLVNTTGTGVPVAYTGTSCTNQFVRALTAVGVATCETVVFATDTSGTVGVSRGGTGLTAGTSGGVLAFTATGTLASSAALTVNRLVLGGGAGAVPTVLGTLGTTDTLLHGNAAGAPTFGPVALATEVSGLLSASNGGTSNGFFAVSGPATSTKTYTFPNASSTVLTSNAAVTAAQGGTGQTTYTIGDLLQATGATTLSKLAATSTGNALISGGVATASAWGKIGLTTHVSGTLGPTNGGTGFAAYTVGDLLYANSTTSLARLAASTDGLVLTSNGAGIAPSWGPGSALRSATVTLTNAQIMTLPMTPVTLVTAQGNGFWTRIHSVSFSLVANAGGYANIDATYAALTVNTATSGWLVTPIANDNSLATPLDRLTDFLGSAQDVVVVAPPFIEAIQNAGTAGTAQWTVPATTLGTDRTALNNAAIILQLDNNGTGNLTMGNAGNSLKVTVYYSKEAL